MALQTVDSFKSRISSAGLASPNKFEIEFPLLPPNLGPIFGNPKDQFLSRFIMALQVFFQLI